MDGDLDTGIQTPLYHFRYVIAMGFKTQESEAVWASIDLKSGTKPCESLMVYSAKYVIGHL